MGDGEGERDGQAESSDKRSEYWRAAANVGGLMKTALPAHKLATSATATNSSVHPIFVIFFICNGN